jgi:putative acetyltransferase
MRICGRRRQLTALKQWPRSVAAWLLTSGLPKTTRASLTSVPSWHAIGSSRWPRPRRSIASRLMWRGLLDPAISLFSVRADDIVLGIGALKRLGPHHAEIKSMHTAEAARGRGIGRAMLAHLLGVARARGFRRVSLETGTTSAFAPARTLYESAGFVACGPFGSYRPSEDNTFMTLDLGTGSRE